MALAKIIIIVISLGFFLEISSPDVEAQTKQVICVDSRGRLSVKTKCKRGESKLNRGTLKGDTGNQGVPGRGITEALSSGTGIKGAAGGVFSAPGVGAGDPWSVVTSFNALIPTPLTSDKVIISQRKLREFCRAATNADTVDNFADLTTNDCLRTDADNIAGIDTAITNQKGKTGQFDALTDDNICTGSPSSPTAPAGYLCIYLTDARDFYLMYADTVPSQQGSEGFKLSWISVQPNGSDIRSVVNFTWAYTAP